MKTLRQLSKYTFLKSLIIFSIFFSSVIAEDEPIDIWKIEKKEKIIDNNSEIEDISDTESNLKIINTSDQYTQIISNTSLEDKDLIVIDKPAGIIMHPGAGNYDRTIVNALINYNKNSLSNIGDELRPGIVHRIDKMTSGLLVIAKDDYCHNILSEQFKDRLIKRNYLS